YQFQFTGALSSTDDVVITVNSCGPPVSGTVTVTANVASTVGIMGVQFQLDGANFGPQLTTAPYAIPWDTTKITNGCHVLTAIAQDTNGNYGPATVTAAVTNP